MEYKISLPVYEGPMELLLDLIKKDEIDIYDIPIAKITDGFMEYIDKAKKINMDLAGDFLIMAAKLLEIKSKMMLPKKEAEVEEEEEDPRDELVQKILEYQKFKELENYFRERSDFESKSLTREGEDIGEIDEIDLISGFNPVDLSKVFNKLLKRAKLREDFEEVSISRDEYSVAACMDEVVRLMEESETILFTQLIGEEFTREKLVTYFLSILELAKIGKIKVGQKANFDDIIIRRGI